MKEAPATRPEIRIEALTTQEQFRAAVRLQKEIWKFEDIELLPARLFTVATKSRWSGFRSLRRERDGGLRVGDSGGEAQLRRLSA